MHVVLRAGSDQIDVEVAVHDPAATIADLAGAISRCGLSTPHQGDGSTLFIDGAPVSGSTPLITTGLRPGCDLAVVGPAAANDDRPDGQGVELAVIGGVAAGQRRPLGLGCSMLGRHAANTVVLPGRTTSGRHVQLDVDAAGLITAADAGSSSGTWIDGRRIEAPEPVGSDAVLAVGASLIRISVPDGTEPAVLGPPGPDGCRPLHRPPPAPMPSSRQPLTPPTDEAAPVDAPRFGWAAALVPLVAGLALARLVDPRLALFTLLGPAVLVGQWLEERRRHRRRGADAGIALRAGMAAFAGQVQAAAMVEARHRRAAHPDAASVGQEIEAVGSQLWSRRPGHPTFAEVTVGIAPALAWSPATTRAPEGPAAAALARSRLPYACPASVAVSSGGHLGLAGARPAALAVARWVVMQLAAHHGPADLRIAVVCGAERAEEWSWAAFLPHTASWAGSGRRMLVAGGAEAAELADLRLHRGEARLVVVVDGAGLLDGGGRAAALAAACSTVTVAPSRRALPGRCTSVLELDGSDGWGRLSNGSEPAQVLLATGIERTTARRWARGLAGLVDPEALDGAPAPTSVRLLDLLGLDRPTSREVRRRWARHIGAATPLGCAGGGAGDVAVHLDLVADGPHMLVAGTTGAGKSELLRSLVAGLAASSPPDRLALLLVDYKGGAAFADAAALPHVVGVVTDLGPEEAARALHSLEAELRRREAVLAALGVRDLADHPAHRREPTPHGIDPLPRLVVVVDELAALVTELPSFLDGLVQLAARGRSLGLHLVLATQRPGSVVSAAVRTNCAIRCCLRVPDEADAVDVVGTTSPARLDRRQAGRAFLRRGAMDLVELQVALVGCRRASGRERVTVGPASCGSARSSAPGAEGDGPSDLALLVEACREAAAEAALAPPPSLWLPPLPEGLAASELPPRDGAAVIGLIDDPAHQRRLPLVWRPRAGPLLAVGSGAGPALALQAAARTLAADLRPDQLHVYGFDLASQNLATLAELAHVGAIIRPGEQERMHRLLRRLTDELAARQAAAGEAPAGSSLPLVLVLIDGAAALRAALDGTAGLSALDGLERVVVDGAGLGLVVALTADRLAAVPPAWAGAASLGLAFRCGDPLDLLSLGVRSPDQTRWPDGRCLELASNLVAQVATGGWAQPAAATADLGPEPVITLPASITLEELMVTAAPHAASEGLFLPLGIDGCGLGVAAVRLRPGQPFLVCGPPGSGRTTTLATLAAAAERAGCSVIGADGLGDRVAARGPGVDLPPLAVFVDDADRAPDPDGALADLAAGRHPGAHLIAAAPADAVRSGFGHWSAELRRAGTGIVLRPRSQLDADVLGVGLLPRWPVPLSSPGRGVLVVDGNPVPVQVALP